MFVPRPGIEPTSPAVQGGFLTTVPTREVPRRPVSCFHILLYCKLQGPCSRRGGVRGSGVCVLPRGSEKVGGGGWGKAEQVGLMGRGAISWFLSSPKSLLPLRPQQLCPPPASFRPGGTARRMN